MDGAVAVIPEDERDVRGLELAERHFPPDRRAQVANYLEVPVQDPALMPYLALCAALNLSPISGHVWLIPQLVKAQDGGEPRTVYKPAIGRDGLLHKARQTKHAPGGYRGIRFGVVCAGDTFEVEDSLDDVMAPPKMLHRFASKPTVFPEGEDPARYRGPVIGAWALCLVDGEPPTFYYANMGEHAQVRQTWDWNPSGGDRGMGAREPLYVLPDGTTTFDARAAHAKPVMVWQRAWDYTSPLILKAAQSYVLRIALGVTGVVPVDELRDVKAWQRGQDVGGPQGVEVTIEHDAFDVSTIVPEDAPDGLGDALQAAVDQANRLEPFSWGPAKCEMVLTGRSAAELAVVVEQIVGENALRAAREQAREAARDRPPDGVPVEEEREPKVIDEEVVGVLRARRAGILASRMLAGDGRQEEIDAELSQVDAELRELLGVGPEVDLG